MNDIPKISVLLSTFNPQEPDLQRAVQSIIDQTFRSWELLIYDDGSDPQKGAFIQDLSRLDKRIKYLKGNANRGLANGLNACIREASGEYIARMDDDDLCLPARFERQVAFLDAHEEYQWVGTLAELFDSNGVWGRTDRPEEPVAKDFFHSSPFIHPSVMFRKAVLINAGGYRVSKKTWRCEDYELFMRLYAQGYRGYNMQEVLFRYQEDAKVLKRSWKYCYYEAVVRLSGFRQLRLLSPGTFHHVLKPLAVRTLAVFPRLAQKIRIHRTKGNYIVVEKRTGSSQS